MDVNTLEVEEPENLFPTRRDAVVYLIGLGGFWGGIAVALIGTDVRLPSFVAGAFAVIALLCGFLHMNTTRKLDTRISGRAVPAWPFGYPTFRTQLIAAFPSTVMAAAQRLSLNAIVVTVAMYSVLVFGLIALLAVPSSR